MSAWSLIIQPDPDLSDEIEKVVTQAIGDRAGKIERAGNVSAAKADIFDRNLGDCRLIITAIALPMNAKTPIGGADTIAGLEFIRKIREKDEGVRIPVMFTAASTDASILARLEKLGAWDFVPLSASWSAELSVRLPRLVNAGSRPIRPRCLNLDILFTGGRECSWRIIGRGVGVENSGPIFVDKISYERLMRWSRRLERNIRTPDWGEQLSDISEELALLLFKNISNIDLMRRFTESKTLVGGMQNTRLRFIVDQQTHPIIFEALRDIELEKSQAYWMLKAPIYRRYDCAGTRYPLFKDRASRAGPINCLLIQADGRAGDVGSSWGGKLEALSDVSREIEDVRKILQAEKESSGEIGRIHVFRADDFPGASIEALRSVFQENAWHLVHFSGHSLRGGDNQGAIVLAPDASGVLDARQLADLMSRDNQGREYTQFFYLSSCRSADAYFVMSLVDQSIPAILGFRWPVEDEHAAAYAVSFYQLLFKNEMGRKYLEYAFLKAKRAMHDKLQKHPIWASPVLTMQVDASEEDAVASY